MLSPPGSATDTQRLRLKGFAVRARMSAVTLRMSAGASGSAPNEPRPPRFETVAVSSAVDRPPPNGPWITGWSSPKRRVNAVCMELPLLLADRAKGDGYHCKPD